MSTFRQYRSEDREACLAIFDANCPDFFLPNERDDFAEFLGEMHDGYEVCDVDGSVAAAFGLVPNDKGENRLCWIMINPIAQGGGLGSAIMQRIISLGRNSRSPVIGIAASHKSAPFFARFGAEQIDYIEDGWGPGMHRVDMEIALL